MREILFRGKRVDNGEWVEGFLCLKNIIKRTRKCFDWRGDYVFDSVEEYKVDSETVGQFTGLTDKNGKKIFEGDIIQGTITSTWAKSVIRCEVAYIKDGFYSIEHKRNKELVTHKLGFARDIEVIGNIHDNPELLEGE